ncbi:MAG: hypothetical protein R2710_26645 [Acidimicrobiales bacterium]
MQLAIFRLDDHVDRFTQSVERLMMRVPGRDMVRQMIASALPSERLEA